MKPREEEPEEMEGEAEEGPENPENSTVVDTGQQQVVDMGQQLVVDTGQQELNQNKLIKNNKPATYNKPATNIIASLAEKVTKPISQREYRPRDEREFVEILKDLGFSEDEIKGG